MRIAIVGAGAMGEAVLTGLLAAGTPASDIVASVRRPARAEELRARHGIEVVPALDAVVGADVVVVGVKPHDVVALLGEVAPRLAPEAVVVSLAAGISVAVLEHTLPDHAVVRAMPNTPAKVGVGITALSPGSRVTDGQLDAVRAVLAGTGEVIVVPEDKQDAVTATSGSGPAYVFLVAEAMTDAAVRLGLPRPQARALVNQTLLGAATLLATSDAAATTLREEVTSPGGTTAAALAVLEERGLRAAFSAAMDACHDRSASMGARADAAVLGE